MRQNWLLKELHGSLEQKATFCRSPDLKLWPGSFLRLVIFLCNLPKHFFSQDRALDFYCLAKVVVLFASGLRRWTLRSATIAARQEVEIVIVWIMKRSRYMSGSTTWQCWIEDFFHCLWQLRPWTLSEISVLLCKGHGYAWIIYDNMLITLWLHHLQFTLIFAGVEAGLGLFATKALPANQLVVHYGGSQTEARKLCAHELHIQLIAYMCLHGMQQAST